MSRRHHPVSSSKSITKHVIYTSILSFVYNITILGISVSQEKWILGDVACQLSALLSYFLLSTATWMMALAAFERFYKSVSPDDHACTFSNLNTRILVFGIYVMTFVFCTGPLYGWGEYSDLKGKMDVIATFVQGKEKEDMKDNETLFVNTFIPQVLCSSVSVSEKVEVIDVLKVIGSSLISSQWSEIQVRPPRANCVTGEIRFILRARDQKAVSNFYGVYQSGNLTRVLLEEFNMQFYNFTQRHLNLSVQTWMDTSAVNLYKTTIIPFQSLGICTLDFSPLNDFVISSTLYMLVTTVLIPYGVMIFSGIGLLWKYKTVDLHMKFAEITFLKVILFCGCLSLLSCLPYYIINYMNLYGYGISKGIHVSSMVLFYSANMCVILPYRLYRLFEVRYRARHLVLSKMDTIALKERGRENSNNENCIQYGSV